MNINTSLNKFKEHIKDNAVKGYHLIFKLINNNDITFSTTIEEFNNIKKWYESKSSESYSLKQDNRYVNLNKVNIVEFSYSTITNKKSLLNPIMYILTSPAPRTIDVFSYVKGLFLVPIALVCYIIYEKYMLDINIKNILSNTTMINHIFSSAVAFLTILFAIYYTGYFIFRIYGMSNQNKDYIYEVKNQTKNKVYTYAVFNFVLISFFAHALLSINLL